MSKENTNNDGLPSKEVPNDSPSTDNFQKNFDFVLAALFSDGIAPSSQKRDPIESKTFKINGNTYQYERELGEGKSSACYLFKCDKNQQYLKVKASRNPEKIKNEYKFISIAYPSTKNKIKKDEDYYYLCSEFYDGMTVFPALRNYVEKKSDAIEIFLQIAVELKRLQENHQICHGDISTANIIILKDSNHNIKIKFIDFEYAYQKNQFAVTRNQCVHNWAPERCTDNKALIGKFNQDIYSLAYILNHSTKFKAYDKKSWVTCPLKLINENFIYKALDEDNPNSRPSIDTVIKVLQLGKKQAIKMEKQNLSIEQQLKFCCSEKKIGQIKIMKKDNPTMGTTSVIVEAGIFGNDSNSKPEQNTDNDNQNIEKNKLALTKKGGFLFTTYYSIPGK